MSVTFIDNTVKIMTDNDRGANLALRYMADDIHRIANPKTPRDQGNLRRNVLKQVLGKRAVIAWKSGYAIFQETKQYKNYTTPGTGPHFAENAVKQVIENANSYFKKARLV